MALSTPKDTLLADKPISELRNHSKYDWLFAVFQLYVESCVWKNLHVVHSESLEKSPALEILRQEQVLDEKYAGLPRDGKPIPMFRAWNRLAGIPTDDFQIGDPELQSLDNAMLSPETAKSFNRYMELLPRALESYSYSEAKSPIPVAVWIAESTHAIEQALEKPDCKETLSDLLELPYWDWPLDSPLDFWPHGCFSLDYYYYANLFADWLQNEPAFFNQLGANQHITISKATRTAEMEKNIKQTLFTRKSRLPAWENIRDQYDWDQALIQEFMDNPELDAYFPIGQSKADQIATLSLYQQVFEACSEIWSDLPQSQKTEILEVNDAFIKNYEKTTGMAKQLQGPSPLKNHSFYDIVQLSVPETSPRTLTKIGKMDKSLIVALLATQPRYYPPFEPEPLSSLVSHQTSRLSELPITQLKDKWDWQQAFYELAYGSGKARLDLDGNNEQIYQKFPIGQSKQDQISLIKSSIANHLDLRHRLIEQRKGLPDVSQWVERTRENIEIAHREGLGKSLVDLCVNPPTWYAAEELWHSVIEKPFAFFDAQTPPLTVEHQPKRYASKPYRELLSGGYYKVMLGLYELTHGKIPDLQTDDAEKTFVIEEEAKIHLKEGAVADIQWASSPDYSYLLELVDDWVGKVRERLKTFSELEAASIKSLEEIALAVRPPHERLYLLVLWINIVQHPLEWLPQDANNQKVLAEEVENKESVSAETVSSLSNLSAAQQAVLEMLRHANSEWVTLDGINIANQSDKFIILRTNLSVEPTTMRPIIKGLRDNGFNVETHPCGNAWRLPIS